MWAHWWRDFGHLAMFYTTCVYCMLSHFEENEAEDCLRCPVFLLWFHEACFGCRLTESTI